MTDIIKNKSIQKIPDLEERKTERKNSNETHLLSSEHKILMSPQP